jgi:hypothetical protein
MRRRETAVELARRHVQEAEQRVQRQRERVEQQRRDGHDSASTQELLAIFEESLTALRDHLNKEQRRGPRRR